MFGALGQRVIQLHRVQFAGLGVSELSPGQYRELSETEITVLQNKTSGD